MQAPGKQLAEPKDSFASKYALSFAKDRLPTITLNSTGQRTIAPLSSQLSLRQQFPSPYAKLPLVDPELEAQRVDAYSRAKEPLFFFLWSLPEALFVTDFVTPCPSCNATGFLHVKSKAEIRTVAVTGGTALLVGPRLSCGKASGPGCGATCACWDPKVHDPTTTCQPSPQFIRIKSWPVPWP